jgi:hypothetical protein
MTVPNQKKDWQKECSSIEKNCAKMCEKGNAKVGRKVCVYAGLISYRNFRHLSHFTVFFHRQNKLFVGKKFFDELFQVLKTCMKVSPSDLKHQK